MRTALYGIGAILIIFGVAACGFRPLHLSSGAAPATDNQMAQIDVQPIADRRGQLLRNNLIDRMHPAGPPSEPQYVLRTNLRESIRELASRIDDSSTRANLILTADFSLTAVGESQPILTGRIRSTNNYSISRFDIATLAAERDARQRGTRDIAERMVLQIATFLRGRDFAPRAAR